MPNPANIQSGFPKNASPFVSLKTGLIERPWLLLLISLWNRTGQSSGGGAIASGTVSVWAGATIPDGYLLCDGSAISRTDYPILFSAIGTTWGPGDGSSTFNLPDLRNRFLLGASATHPAGQYGGASSIALSIPNLPPHNHPVVDPGHAHTVTDPGHVHTVADPGHHHTDATPTSLGTTGTDPVGATAGTTGDSTTGISVNANTTGVVVNSHTSGVTVGNTGVGTAFSILPSFAAMLPIIKF